MKSIKIITSRPNQNTHTEIILPVRERNKKKITAKMIILHLSERLQKQKILMRQQQFYLLAQDNYHIIKKT